MIVAWYIYRTDLCRHTTPPKRKYIAIVCLNPNPYGFLINSRISPFIQSREKLLAHQISVTADKYGFLDHNSFIDCSQIFSFKEGELQSIQKIQNNTRTEIKKIVAGSDYIAPIFQKLICGSGIPPE
jgi:hypothetical protein